MLESKFVFVKHYFIFADNSIVLGPSDVVYRHLGDRRGNGLHEARLRCRYIDKAPRADRHTAAAALSVYEGNFQLHFLYKFGT